jgi:small subunit ribosomal protein S17
MADEPENETSETTESPVADAPEQALEVDTSTPESEPTVSEDGAQATELADDAPTGAEDSPQAESAGSLAPKERRRKARSTHTGEARPARSPEERHAERVAERKTKATRRRTRRLQERAKRTAARESGSVSATEPLAPVHAQTEGVRKVRQGVVVSDKADKTITVRIDTARRHRRYEKIVRSSSTLHAHDENNDAHEGDTVRVIESRPLSRSKRWKLVDVLERAR